VRHNAHRGDVSDADPDRYADTDPVDDVHQ
jgi:hypothetical protein